MFSQTKRESPNIPVVLKPEPLEKLSFPTLPHTIENVLKLKSTRHPLFLCARQPVADLPRLTVLSYEKPSLCNQLCLREKLH